MTWQMNNIFSPIHEIKSLWGSCRYVDILHIDLWPLFCAYQVKPLLQVTRQDEEIQAREAELLKAKENLTRVEQDYTELDRKHAQVNKFASGSANCPSMFPLHWKPSVSLWIRGPLITPPSSLYHFLADGRESCVGWPAAGRGRAVCRGGGDEGKVG